MGARSIMKPPSQTEWPGRLWPPPRTATSRSCSAANVTAPITSAALAQRAISAGRRSKAPFQIRRAASYPSLERFSTGPRCRARKSAMSEALRTIALPVRDTAGTSTDSAARENRGAARLVAAMSAMDLETKSRLFIAASLDWPREDITQT
jgi:hypothetical protein